MMKRWLILLILIVGADTAVFAQATRNTPADSGPCAIQTWSTSVNGAATDVYYPQSDSCTPNISAPYPGIVFAHGFSLFGLADGRAENADHGIHLASWGFVVAIPTLPDDAEERATVSRSVLAFLTSETDKPTSPLHQKVNSEQMGSVGYSLGGTTALMMAARDGRVKTAVALDPVYHSGGPGGGTAVWDATEAAQISVPVGILGAPADSCNDQADFAELYPLLGSGHKASYELVGASHCTLAAPGNSFCSFTCGGDDASAHTQRAQSYMTAWLSYYLHHDSDMFAYIYGRHRTTDINAGVIESQMDTAPQGFDGFWLTAVYLSWQENPTPMVEGYEVLRGENGGPLGMLAQVGRVTGFVDTAVATDSTYSYQLQAVDPAGNSFQPSHTLTLTPEPNQTFFYLPTVLK